MPAFASVSVVSAVVPVTFVLVGCALVTSASAKMACRSRSDPTCEVMRKIML